MVNQERLIAEFLDLVRIDSPSKKEGAIAEFLTKKLRDLGMEVLIDEESARLSGCETGNVYGYLKGAKNRTPALLFSAHMDTVMPGENISPVIKDGVISSDGTTILGSDDKSGIVSILGAIRYIRENGYPHGDIEVLFTVGEEIGLLGSKYLNYGLLKSKIGYVLDSGGQPGTIINQGPAQDQITAIIHGRAAHAGFNPEEGISAIQAAAKAIDRMKLLRIDDETTANIGIISGGTATNIVSDYVEIKGEARSLSDEKLNRQTSHMAGCLENACTEIGAQLELNITRAYTSFHVPEDDDVIKLAKTAAQELHLQVVIEPTGGGSDVNNYNTRGIKTINLGTGMSKVHTKEEFIKTDALITMTKFIAAIILTAAKQN